MVVGELTQLVLECDDTEQLARFWREVLGLPEPEGDSDWMTLRWEPVGRFSFHHVAGYRAPAWPGERGEQQAHFDLLVDDLDAASLVVEKAGARPLTDVLDAGPKAWRVYADHAGHPFCLVSVPE
jgi:Glyoxalase-like domain